MTGADFVPCVYIIPKKKKSVIAVKMFLFIHLNLNNNKNVLFAVCSLKEEIIKHIAARE